MFRSELAKIAAGASHDERMRLFCDAAWNCFGNDQLGTGRNISWIGFYVISNDTSEMLLTHRRNKPACSPIGLQGACGQSWAAAQTLVVTDVAHLGKGYIACDPRDKAELVIPVLEADGTCIGVLDADSYDSHAFTEHDAREFHAALVACNITHNQSPPIRVI